MEIYLLRHGEADTLRHPDPYTCPLTEAGHAQALALAEQCLGWDVQFICASVMARAMETADAISQRLPHAERWDLAEIEEVNLDDLMGEPTAGPLLESWTPEQLRYGYERTWVRVTAAWARIEIMAASRGYRRVAIVGHDSTIALLLLAWLGLDWRALDQINWAFAPGSSTRVTLSDQGQVSIDWVNRV